MEELKRTVTSVEGRVTARHDDTTRGGGVASRATDASLLDEPGPTVIPFRGGGHVLSSSLRQVRATALIDRVEEMETIGQLLLSEDVRLLTLVGPAGVGKTRLAQEAGDQLASSFSDGVSYVDLTSICDPVQVLPAIARAHGIRETENRPPGGTARGAPE
jgi:Cdc6-like AAA superfamily ATPase